jgi:hypothetical protein
VKIPNRGLLSATPSFAMKTSFPDAGLNKSQYTPVPINGSFGSPIKTTIPKKYTELMDRGNQTELSVIDKSTTDSSCQYQSEKIDSSTQISPPEC